MSGRSVLGSLLALAVAAGPAVAETYAYDALGRVVSVVADDGRQTLYSYDAAGNRASVVVNASGSVQPPKVLPISLSYTFGTTEPYQINVSDWVSDPNGQGWTLTGVSNPAFGSASFSSPIIAYTPPTYAGPPVDTFSYSIRNNAGLTASGVVSISLVSGLQAASFSAPFVFGSATPLVVQPLGQASDPGAKSISIVAVAQPARGSTSFNTASISYDPPSSHTPGNDPFGYTIQDNTGVQSSGTITIQLSNAAPVAAPYNITAPSVGSNTSYPLDQASDPSGNPLTVNSASQGAHGSTSITSTSIVYTAASGYAGSDSFSYTVADNYGNVSAPATVGVTVTQFTPQPITAQPISAQATQGAGILQNACSNVTNPGGYALTLTGLTTPNIGSVTQTSSCVFKYTAPNQNGTASFQYTVSDPYGSTTSTVTVQITNE